MSAGILLLTLSFLFAPPLTDTIALCTPHWQIEHPETCPPLGPGDYAAGVMRAHVPQPVPPLPIEAQVKPDPVLDRVYARVITPDAPLFASPEDALAGNVKKSLGRGFIYVNLVEAVTVGGQAFYLIRSGDYVRAADVSVIKPTDFQGLLFTGQPAYPFGWIVAKVRPSRRPGAAPLKEDPFLYRRKVVQIFAAQRVNGWNWYLVGQNQWVEQRAIARVDLHPPPAGISGKWIQVDLYEQTLAAYDDTQLVYATLVSTGLDKWATQPGLFRIWSRQPFDLMRGSYEPDGSDYYYLEAVPWVMYFDGARGLHGEYWHDRLGFKRSHGCVNLAPLDARWLYGWAEKGTAVWVYDPSAPASGTANGSAE